MNVVSGEDLEQLDAEARYARERYQLYRAKSYGPRATSPARMRELQRIYEYAEARLHAAQARERQAVGVKSDRVRAQNPSAPPRTH